MGDGLRVIRGQKSLPIEKAMEANGRPEGSALAYFGPHALGNLTTDHTDIHGWEMDCV